MSHPVVLVSACIKMIGQQPYHCVQEKYLSALTELSDCVPLLIPALGQALDLASLLQVADGLYLTGSYSNVHPAHYGQALLNPRLPQDPARDATTLMLVRAAIQHHIPVLAICRGFQEVNVALGGTLHQAVHTQTGMLDHRENPADVPERQYAPAHIANLNPSGKLTDLLNGTRSIQVNSLHGQGILKLAPGLQEEARSSDGLIEAFSLQHSAAFLIGVQWHPEWQAKSNPVSVRIFQGFAQACEAYRHSRRSPYPP